MVTVQIDEDTAVDMLMKRLDYWTDDEEVKDLYRKMYESYVGGGCFDGGEFDIMSIVDNDYVNWCSTLCQEDCSEADWNKLVELYEEGTRDISCEEFEDINYDFIEAMNEDKTMALMRC
jgi:hypothetical protein